MLNSCMKQWNLPVSYYLDVPMSQSQIRFINPQHIVAEEYSIQS